MQDLSLLEERFTPIERHCRTRAFPTRLACTRGAERIENRFEAAVADYRRAREVARSQAIREATTARS
jgi:hypothetical protein